MRNERFVLQKGMLLGVSGWWFVLVEAVYYDGMLRLHCICDNANNIYSHAPDEVDTFLTLTEVGNVNWGWPDELDLYEGKYTQYRRREIPYDVVAEVLTGRHDDRFTHWSKTKATSTEASRQRCKHCGSISDGHTPGCPGTPKTAVQVCDHDGHGMCEVCVPNGKRKMLGDEESVTQEKDFGGCWYCGRESRWLATNKETSYWKCVPGCTAKGDDNA